MNKFKGNVIYTAWNHITKREEQVFAGDEIEADEMVIVWFWDKASERYITLPGTEVYGYVPQE